MMNSLFIYCVWVYIDNRSQNIYINIYQIMSKQNTQEKSPSSNFLRTVPIEDIRGIRTPEKNQNQTIMMKGKVSPGKKSQSKSNNKQYIIETDSREISRIIIESNKVNENGEFKTISILKLQTLWKLKTMKWNYRFFINMLMREGKTASCLKILNLTFNLKLKSMKHLALMKLINNAKGRKRNQKNVIQFSYFLQSFKQKKLGEFFKKLMRFNIHMLKKKNNSASLNPPEKKSESSLGGSRKNSTNSIPRPPKKGQQQKETIITKNELEQLSKQNQQMKIMALSNEIRQILLKMYQFDNKTTYSQQSQKILKTQVQIQLKKFEKTKITNKTPKGKYFDNELTLTVLNNHLKAIVEIIRQIDDFSGEKEQLQKKLNEITLKYKQIISKKVPEEATTKLKIIQTEAKQIHKLNEIVFNTIKEGNVEKIKKTLETQIKKHQPETQKENILDRKQFLEILLNYVRESSKKPQKLPEDTNLQEKLSSELKILFTQQTNIDYQISVLQKQLSIYNSKSNNLEISAQKNLYINLSQTCQYLNKLFITIKEKDNEITQITQKVTELEKKITNLSNKKTQQDEKYKTPQNNNKYKGESESIQKKPSIPRKPIQRTKIQEYTFQDWEKYLKIILSKMQKKNEWYDDLEKQYKLILNKKNTQKTINLITLNFNIFKVLRSQIQSGLFVQQEKSKEQIQKIKKQYIINIEQKYILKQTYEKQIKITKQEITKLKYEINQLTKNKSGDKSVSPPPQQNINNVEINQIIRLCGLVDTALSKMENDGIVIDWLKLKKAFENKKKLNTLVSVATTIQNLLKIHYQNDDRRKKEILQNQKIQSQKVKELNMILNQNELIIKQLDDQNIKMNDNTINKLKKLIEMNLVKVEKISEIYNFDLIRIFKDALKSKMRLLKFIQDLVKELKQLNVNTSELRLKSNEIEQRIKTLENQINSLSKSLALKETDIIELKNQNETYKIEFSKIKQIEKSTLIQESSSLKKLEQEKSNLETTIKRKENQLKKLEEKNRQNTTKIEQYLKQIKSYKEVIQVYGYQEKVMLQKIQQAQNKLLLSQSRLEVLEVSVKELENEKSILEKEKLNTKKIKEDNAALQKKLKERQEKYAKSDKQKTQKIKDLENEIKKIQANMQKLLKINEALQQKISNEVPIEIKKPAENQQIKSLKQKNLQLQKKLQNLKKEYETLNRDYENVMKENQLILTKSEQFQKINMSLNNQITKYEAELKEKSRTTLTRKQKQTANIKIKELEETLKKLNQQIKSSDQRYQQTIKEHILSYKSLEQTYKNSISTYQKKLEQQQQAYRKLQEYYLNRQQTEKDEQQIKKSKKIIQDLEKEVNNYKENEIKLKIEIEETNQQRKEVYQKYDKKEEQRKKYEEQVNRLNKILNGKMKEKKEKQEKEKEDKEKMIKQIQEMSEKIENVKKERIKMQEEYNNMIKQLEGRISTYQSNENRYKSQLDSLRIQLTTLSTQTTNNITIQLKNQEDYYLNIIKQLEGRISTYQSNENRYKSQLDSLRIQLTTLSTQTTNNITIQLKNQEDYYLNIIKQLEGRISTYQSNENRYKSQLDSLRIQLTTLSTQTTNNITIQLKNQEDYYLNIIKQLEGSISTYQSNENRYKSQLDSLRIQLTTLSTQTTNNITIQLKNQEDYYLNIIKQLEGSISTYQSNENRYKSQLDSLRIKLGSTNNNKIQLKNQEDYYLNIIKQLEGRISTYQSNENRYKSQLDSLRIQLGSTNNNKIQLKNQEDYYLNIIKQLEGRISTYQSNENRYKSQLDSLRIQLTTLSTQTTNNITIQLKNQEDYYLNIIKQLEGRISTYQSNENRYKSQLDSLRIQLTTLSTQTTNNITIQLKNQEDYYLNIIKQLEGRISTYQSNENRYKSQLDSLRIQLGSRNNNKIQLKNQEDYYLNIIKQLEGRISTYQSNENRYKSQLDSLRIQLTTLSTQTTNNITIQLKNQEDYYLNIIKQLEGRISTYQSNENRYKSQLDSLRIQLTTLSTQTTNNITIQLKNQEDYYLNIIKQLEGRISTYQSNENRYKSQLDSLRIQLGSTNNNKIQLKNQEDYYLNIIKQLEGRISTYQSNENRYKSQLDSLRIQLTTLSTQTTNNITIQLKNQEDYYLNIIKQLEGRISTYQSNENRYKSQLDSLRIQLGSTNNNKIQLKNQEDYYLNIIKQLEGRISTYQSNENRYKSQLDSLRIQLTTLSTQTTNNITIQLKNQEDYYLNIIKQLEGRISTYQSNENRYKSQLDSLRIQLGSTNNNKIQLKNQEDYYLNIIKQLEGRISTYQSNENRYKSQLDSLRIQLTTLSTQTTNNITIQLKNQEDYYLNIIKQLEGRISTYQSNENRYKSQLDSLRIQLGSTNNNKIQLKNQEDYYLNIIKQLEGRISTYQSNENRYKSQLDSLRIQLTTLSTQTTNNITIQLKNQEDYYLNIIKQLEGRISTYQSNENRYKSQLDSLRIQLTTLSTQTTNNITIQLKNQEDYYLNIIKQLEGRISTYQSNENRYKSQLDSLRIQLGSTNNNKIQLKNQEDYYLKIIQQQQSKISNINTLLNKYSIQIQNFRKSNITLTQQLSSFSQLKLQYQTYRNQLQQLQNKHKLSTSISQQNISHLTSTIKKLQSQNKFITSQFQKQKSQLKELVSLIQIYKAQKSFTYYQNQIDNLKRQKDYLKSQLNQFNVTNQQLLNNIQTLKSKLNSSQSKLKQLKQKQYQLTIESLKTKYIEYQKIQNLNFSNLLQENTTLKNKINEEILRANNFVEQLKSNIQILQTENLQLRTNLNIVSQEKLKMVSELSGLKIIIENQKNQILNNPIQIELENELHKAKMEIKNVIQKYSLLEQSMKMVQKNWNSKEQQYLSQIARFTQDLDSISLRLKLVKDQRQEFESKWSLVSKQKQTLYQKLQKTQELLSMQENIYNKQGFEQTQKIKYLESQLKKITEKYQQALRIDGSKNFDQMSIDQQRRQNQILRQKIRQLETIIKSLRQKKVHFSTQYDQHQYDERYLLKTEGARLKQNIFKIEKANNQLLQKLNQLTKRKLTNEDFNEITILKKVNVEISQLVESNRNLIARIKELERENQLLNQNLRMSSETNNGQLIISFFSRLHLLVINLSTYLQSEDIGLVNYSSIVQFTKKLEAKLGRRQFMKYIEILEEFLKQSILDLVEQKNQTLSKQAKQLLNLKDQMTQLVDEHIEEMRLQDDIKTTPKSVNFHHSIQHQEHTIDNDSKGYAALKYLFKLYMKTKNPQILQKINEMLNEDEHKYFYNVDHV